MSTESTEIDLGVTADFHVHLREGKMMELVTPTIRDGGVSIAYIMPNLVPPVTTVEKALEYKAEIQKLSPKTTFLMTFYLCKALTPELIHEAAAKNAIAGVKCYPGGVTTNSSADVDPNDFSAFYPVFKAMEEENLVLNLHGEKPSTNKEGEEEIHILNAEPKFLPALEKLHKDFPNLKIVLEHCTTKVAIEAVRKINANNSPNQPIKVAASITAHHLSLIIDDWAGNPINYCKPVAKLPQDRKALIDAATSGEPYFFFGSDSAPHPINAKAKHVGVCAGVFTQSCAIPYIAEAFDKCGKLDNLKKFVNDNGKAFYEISDDKVINAEHCILYKKTQKVPELLTKDEVQIAPFKAGDELEWSVKWK